MTETFEQRRERIRKYGRHFDPSQLPRHANRYGAFVLDRELRAAFGRVPKAAMEELGFVHLPGKWVKGYRGRLKGLSYVPSPSAK